MAICTIDNPDTMRRECWQDGVLYADYDMKLFYIKPFPIPAGKFFFGANIGGWKMGQVVGDIAAMREG